MKIKDDEFRFYTGVLVAIIIEAIIGLLYLAYRWG